MVAGVPVAASSSRSVHQRLAICHNVCGTTGAKSGSCILQQSVPKRGFGQIKE